MALAAFVPWLLLVSSSALTLTDLSLHGSPSLVQEHDGWQAGANAFARLGNFTPLAALQIKNPIPALAGCAGFDCVVRYCAFQDGAFSWGVDGVPQQGQTRGTSWTRYDLRLSSQAWMANSTERAAWYHNLTVVVPHSLKAGSKQAGWATMIITGEYDPLHAVSVEELAARTGAIAAAVNNVPNQNLHFATQGRGTLDEETLKAWSWAQYARHADHPEWPVEMPDVKAVVRALDALKAFSEQGGSLAPMPKIDRFVVTGESKRGIATYMTGAVDPRVKAIMPLVISLNLGTTKKETMADLGGIGFAALPYIIEGTYGLNDADADRLHSIIDPLTYAGQLTMPKMIVNAGMDMFFPPDITRSWLWKLPQPTTFLMCGNAHHGGYHSNHDFLDVADAFINGQILGKAAPNVTYSFSSSTGEIRVRQASNHTPTAVRLWTSRTQDDKMRDFRSTPWSASSLPSVPGSAPREWLATVPAEAGHWTAFYVELEYPGPRLGGAPWRISTEVSVVPLDRPFAQVDFRDPQNWKLVLAAQNSSRKPSPASSRRP